MEAQIVSCLKPRRVKTDRSPLQTRDIALEGTAVKACDGDIL